MNLAIIVALDEHNGIGFQNRLPWSLPDDLKRFKALTMGHHIIAGRKTWESIGRTLPGRRMIVISRQADYQAPGCAVVGSFHEAVDTAGNAGEDVCFVIGGAQIFALSIHQATRLYLTKVHAVFPADVYFPEYDPGQWQVETEVYHPPDGRHLCAFSFIDLSRKLSAG